nr:DcrB-related protein [Photorhabdus tasmaniensis]
MNISRDQLIEGEELPGYLTHQKGLLKNGLRNWQLLEEQPATLGDNLRQGTALLSRYRPKKGQQVYQYQAVFRLDEKKRQASKLAPPLLHWLRAARTALRSVQSPGGFPVKMLDLRASPARTRQPASAAEKKAAKSRGKIRSTV